MGSPTAVLARKSATEFVGTRVNYGNDIDTYDKVQDFANMIADGDFDLARLEESTRGFSNWDAFLNGDDYDDRPDSEPFVIRVDSFRSEKIRDEFACSSGTWLIERIPEEEAKSLRESLDEAEAEGEEAVSEWWFEEGILSHDFRVRISFIRGYGRTLRRA